MCSVRFWPRIRWISAVLAELHCKILDLFELDTSWEPIQTETGKRFCTNPVLARSAKFPTALMLVYLLYIRIEGKRKYPHESLMRDLGWNNLDILLSPPCPKIQSLYSVLVSIKMCIFSNNGVIFKGLNCKNMTVLMLKCRKWCWNQWAVYTELQPCGKRWWPI